MSGRVRERGDRPGPVAYANPGADSAAESDSGADPAAQDGAYASAYADSMHGDGTGALPMSAPLPACGLNHKGRCRHFPSLIDHNASIAAYQAVTEDVHHNGEFGGPLISYATVSLIIETFLAARERTTLKRKSFEIGTELLEEVLEFLEDRADAEYVGDPPQARGNRAMYLLSALREEMGR